MAFDERRKRKPSEGDNGSDSNVIGKTGLNITGGKPLTEAYLNTFFKLFNAEQVMFFEELYVELKSDLDKLNITGEMFMKYAKEAYMRYQTYKKLDAFQPMDKKRPTVCRAIS